MVRTTEILKSRGQHIEPLYCFDLVEAADETLLEAVESGGEIALRDVTRAAGVH